MSLYLRPFSLTTVNSGSEDIENEHLIEIKCWEYPGLRKRRKGAAKGKEVNTGTEEALIVPNYHEIAEHFKFINQDLDLENGATKDSEGNFDIHSSQRIDAMTIIFNMTGAQP